MLSIELSAAQNIERRAIRIENSPRQEYVALTVPPLTFHINDAAAGNKLGSEVAVVVAARSSRTAVSGGSVSGFRPHSASTCG